uniref:MATH domain-containing protein n=1 Tax=Arundo donax TaxID=35708 RepID=A0A0A8ZXU8_ARUDO
MGNSCVTGACRRNPEFLVRSNVAPPSAEQSQTTFKWSIDDFSSLLDMEGWTYSGVFGIMGLNWYLMLNLKGRKIGDENEYVSLMLGLVESSVKPDNIVKACFNFLIYDQSYGKHNEHQVSYNFHSSSTISGTSCMVPLRTLKKQSSGFFVNNSCIFGVEFIKVVIAKVNTISQTFFIHKRNTCNETKTYTWHIEDFFALKNPDYSPGFAFGGYEWSIKIYPVCDGNHLSLYLNKKTPSSLSKDSGDLVEFTLSIKDQERGKHKKAIARVSTNTGSTWGSNKFISLEDFKDASNGYLIKTKCCIEAKVAIVDSKSE